MKKLLIYCLLCELCLYLGFCMVQDNFLSLQSLLLSLPITIIFGLGLVAGKHSL